MRTINAIPVKVQDTRLQELLLMRLAKVQAKKEAGDTPVVEVHQGVIHTGDETREQREARLMNDEGAWDSFEGNRRSILPI